MNSYILNEKKYHDRVAQGFAETRMKDFIWEIPEQLLMLKPKYFVNKRVIDMGCGPVINIKNILSTKILDKCEYIGIDISKKMLDIAKKNISSGKFICTDMSTVKICLNSIDTIFSFGSLHHVENKIQTLNHWNKMLKHGGHYLFREPLLEALRRGQGASPMEEGIKIDEILDYFKLNNIKVIKLYYFGSPLFHIANRILSKLFNSFWINTKLLWYPLMILDLAVSTILSNRISNFKADSIILIAKKL